MRERFHIFAPRNTVDKATAFCTLSKSPKEIVFTRNATESINLVSSTWGHLNIKAGDEVLISQAEHHANLVPWQQLCLAVGAKLIITPVSDEGDFIKEEFIKQKLRLIV